MGVTRVTILTSEFAAAVWVDRPAKGHVGLGPVEQRARGQLEILHFSLGFEQFALGGQTRDPYQLHTPFSPFVRHKASQKIRGIKGTKYSVPLVTAADRHYNP